MYPALIALAAQVGAPLVKDVLSRQIGAGNAGLITDVVASIASGAGITTSAVEDIARTDPKRIEEAMLDVESELPAMITLYTAELEAKVALIAREDAEGALSRAWRPLGMYLILALWLYSLVVVHVANAIWKIALPADLPMLMQFTALYLSLYMGGHTVKAVVAQMQAKA